MIGLFSSIQFFIKRSTICTDGVVFRLHCKATVMFLVGASILVSCRQYFGDPIYCLQDQVKQTEIVDNFCWIHSTFVLPQAWNLPVGSHVPHPGIDTATPEKPRKYHVYYQWVAFVLLLQGLLFYLPHYLWKVWEKGTIKALTLNLQTLALPPEESKKSYELLSHALRIHWGHFSCYFLKYVFCELLSFVNVVLQMLLLDYFLGGSFSNFGIRVLQWSEWEQYDRTDPLVQAFPRVTKCIFHHFGSGGGVQRSDAMCVLPLNILNEKIFIILWFWMVLLGSLIGLVLVYRVMLCYVPVLRYSVLKFKAPLISSDVLDTLVQNSKISDWFVLYLLSKNISSQHYRSVLKRLVVSLERNQLNPRLSTEENTYV